MQKPQGVNTSFYCNPALDAHYKQEHQRLQALMRGDWAIAGAAGFLLYDTLLLLSAEASKVC
jgi:hypothetical protein